MPKFMQALVMGTHDYVTKSGFQKVVVGLSGGIDSSITAVIAVDALGEENVIGRFHALSLLFGRERMLTASCYRRIWVSG